MGLQQTMAMHLRNCFAGTLALVFLVAVLLEPTRQFYHRAQDWQAARGALQAAQSQGPNRSGDLVLDPLVQQQRLQDLQSKYEVKDPSAKLTLVAPLQISDAGR